MTSVLVGESSNPNVEAGFSLIELMIVVSIAFIAAAVAMINMQTALRGVRLGESGTQYANLLQQARVRAVQDDRFYTVLTGTDQASGAPFAFVDLAGTGVYVSGNPRAVFASGVTPTAVGAGPSLTNLKSQFLPPGTTAQNSLNTAAAGPTFGPRGLPCTPNTVGGYTTCPFLTPTSYVTFLQNQQGGAWEAITVTPAGRIREWTYNGTTWSPLN